MCGIIGEMQFGDGSMRDESMIHHLSGLMARRGPDDAGVWRDGNRAWLAFRRLSILDLSPAGHQPMTTSEGRFALVFNGEVYNFAELRDELRHFGFTFRSTGDAEVVLQALVHWGTRALDRFNGMFALGFYDREKRSLLLARDHAGIKPLYYLRDEQGIFFASQYDQVLAHPWREGLRVSADGLALYLRLGHIPAPYALLEHTHMLEPGSWLQATADGRIDRDIYFRFPKFQKPELSGDAANEAVDAAVSAAVRRQMVSDVPLGAFLSGGIDSPLVVAKMAGLSGRRVRAYTIGSAGSPFDESADAAAYARQLGVEHVLEQLTPNRALDWLDDVIDALKEPLADYSIFPTLMVSYLARRDMKVMLSGDGGDELFWGYTGRFASVVAAAHDFRQPRWQRNARWAARRFTGLGSAHENLRWPTIGDWYRQKHMRVNESELATIFPTLPDWPQNYDLFNYHGWRQQTTAQWLRWNEFTSHLSMVLLKVDRASMHNSLEVRVPLLDRELIAVACRVDWRSCLDLETGLGKLPLRFSLARHVDRQTEAKRGFQIPMADWLRGPLRDAFRTVVLPRQELLGLGINQPALQAVFDAHLAGKADYGYFLWLLLSLALWTDTHFAVPKIAPGGEGFQ